MPGITDPMQVPDEERGWKFEIDIREVIVEDIQLGLPFRLGPGDDEKWLRISYDGATAFEARLHEFTLYMPWIEDFQEFFDNANKELLAKQKFMELLASVGFTLNEAVEELAAKIKGLNTARNDEEGNGK